MSNSFTKDMASSVINRDTKNVVDNKMGTINRNFYTIETGAPIPLAKISKRLVKRFKEIDNQTHLACIDLFFIHANWKTFYKRKDSFSAYITNDLKISRTHAYGLINSVKSLIQYFEISNGHIDDFLTAISDAIQNIGIKKMINISSIKDEKLKLECIEKALSGGDVSIPKKSPEVRVLKDIRVKENSIYYKQKELLVIKSLDERIVNKIVTLISKSI